MNVKLGITMLALLGASACGSKPNDEPTAHAPLFVCAGPDPAPVLVLEIDEGYFAAVDDRYVYVKDDESIAAADEHGIAMVFTGIRHFKH